MQETEDNEGLNREATAPDQGRCAEVAEQDIELEE